MNNLEQLVNELNTSAEDLQLLKALDESSQLQLLEHIKEARKANEKHIHKKLELALEHFPRLLRGPVKRILGL